MNFSEKPNVLKRKKKIHKTGTLPNVKDTKPWAEKAVVRQQHTSEGGARGHKAREAATWTPVLAPPGRD